MISGTRTADIAFVSPPATAVVVTYRRPGLASRVVRGLLVDEKLPGSQVILVINGEGGLDDAELEAAVTVLRLADNIGPAGGFAWGFRVAHDRCDMPWIYACEDDAVLEGFPSSRLGNLVERVETYERVSPGPPIGVVGTFGWDIDPRTGRTWRHRVDPPESQVRLAEVDFVGWGGYTLVSAKVLDAGIFPDEALFWGAEDLDFCLRVQRAGFRVLMDLAAHVDRASRSPQPPLMPRRSRPGRDEEPWCSYYMARNGFLLRRRFGNVRWTAVHLLKSARRFQLAPTRAHRTAIIRGLVDGFVGKTGKHPAFVRQIGEW